MPHHLSPLFPPHLHHHPSPLHKTTLIDHYATAGSLCKTQLPPWWLHEEDGGNKIVHGIASNTEKGMEIGGNGSGVWVALWLSLEENGWLDKKL